MNTLLTEELRRQMLEQGARTARGDDRNDPVPLVRLFTPDDAATWLLSELDPTDPDLAFGLCDLGVGFPELGYVRLSDLAELHGHLGLSVERDVHFTASRTLSEYARLASAEGRTRP